MRRPDRPRCGRSPWQPAPDPSPFTSIHRGQVMTIEAQREPQSVTSHSATQLAPGLAYLRDRIVNVAFIASVDGRDDPWILVDAGLPGAASRIIQAADELFGPDSAPAAIVLTHGHFDHVGSLREL